MNPLEIKLIKQAQKGDKAAFEELFLMEKEYLYKCAFLYTMNREDAFDIVQNCIVKCMVSIKELREPRYFRTWMTKIMINSFNTERTKQRRYVLQEEEVWHEDNKELSTEEKMDLYHAIDHLKFPYKEIIVQHYFACNKLSEIAEMLDMSIGTVKAYHSKAKATLREMMEVEI